MNEQATFGGGCFWCTESVFKSLRGVETVTSGYTGGTVKNPSYREVCSGSSGHAEVVHIEFNPEEIDFKTLVEVHLTTHDPTTLNRQGADSGTQYRSAIFYHSPQQQAVAQAVIEELNDAFPSPIVTQLAEASTFYPAEDYHHDYYAQNPENPYCYTVIAPKLAKLRAKYAALMK